MNFTLKIKLFFEFVKVNVHLSCQYCYLEYWITLHIQSMKRVRDKEYYFLNYNSVTVYEFRKIVISVKILKCEILWRIYSKM